MKVDTMRKKIQKIEVTYTDGTTEVNTEHGAYVKAEETKDNIQLELKALNLTLGMFIALTADCMEICIKQLGVTLQDLHEYIQTGSVTEEEQLGKSEVVQ